MDQINAALRWMKKNKFWLGCFLMSALMIGIWCFRVFTAIDQQTKKNTQTINTKISTAQTVARVSAEGLPEDARAAHPNTKSQEGIQAEMEATVASILEAWEKRVDDQRKILKWPSDVIGSPDFAETFKRYDPPELIPATWLQGDGKLGRLLKLYKENIPQQMVVLTGDDLLRTRWNFDPQRLRAAELGTAQTVRPGGRSGGGYDDEYGDDYGGGRNLPGSRGPSQEAPGFVVDELTGELIDLNSYAVIWDDTNQELWHTKMTSFKNRDDHDLPTNTPTPLQCCMLQQDLWLLEALFRIIREVNGDADANDISTIKELHHVVFGRDVGGKLGQLTPFDPKLGAGVGDGLGGLLGGGDEFGGRGDDGYNDERGEYGEGRIGDGPPKVSPYHQRYVDLNFEPLPAEKVKEIIESADLPEEGLEMIVSKRVPVRIAVRMKETEIATFMAACANSPFAFEIQQVRWNKHQKGEPIELGGGQQRGFFGRGSGGYGTGRDGSINPALILESTPVEVRTNYDVNVEFYGIVKIYNPVRPKFLRDAIGLEDEEVDPNDAASIQSGQAARSRL